MPNALLTSQVITREALRILHQKLNFVGNMNRGYDDSFAKTGAKIGDTLRIRLPNQYTVRNGRVASPQDTTENSVTLQINNQKGVDVSFTSAELTLSLDDFSTRVLEPAMTGLAAAIEADAFSMALDVPYAVNNIGAPITLRAVLNARQILQDNLAPEIDRSVILNTQDNVDLVDSLKGLFNDPRRISDQYRKGRVSEGETAGFEFYENTLIPRQLTGSAVAGATGYTTSSAGQTGATLAVTGAATTFKKGDVFTITGVNQVHSETRVDLGKLQQFVVTADYAGGAGNIAISPAIVTSGPYQNVSGSPANGASINKVGNANSFYKPSLAFQKDAFTFATADLILPNGVDMRARETMDGISMRMVRAYDVTQDTLITRFDVLYGFKTLRPQLAVRILSN